MRGQPTANIFIDKFRQWHHAMIKPEHAKAFLIKREIESELHSKYDGQIAGFYKLFHLRYTLLLNQFKKSKQILHECIANRTHKKTSLYYFYFLFFRGLCCHKFKKNDAGAIRFYQKAEAFIPFLKSLTNVEKADFYYHYGLSLSRCYKIDRSIYAARLALSAFKKEKYLECAAKCKVILGVNYQKKGKAAVSEHHYLQAVTLAKYTSNRQLIHTSYHHLGDLYSIEGKSRKAINYYKKSLQLIDIGEYLARAETSFEITKTLISAGKHKEALKWCDAGLQYARRHELIDYTYHFQILYHQLTDGFGMMLYKYLENEAIPFFKMKNEPHFVQEYTRLMMKCHKENAVFVKE
ncbi:tetratricopeptide (TPR) repeat protein [Scopulibacillus daqui]|uniref:Tetratricopeptide (TPR) repeat protein n=1 Tax=Scopulibacillus daqui TaxID=1469162 RepID=A0ABS2PV39_9BACL|nr:tetratricopeptide repeat protein [Scopulibacillus daqui]MBM7643917.1 tetratricopeptide (TPR) repeat protein [Scopulibacillus daqui]